MKQLKSLPEAELPSPEDQLPDEPPVELEPGDVLSPEEIEQLVNDNMKLAYHYANKWYVPNLSDEDKVSMAVHGLVKAANTYQKSKGPFAAFAGRIIRNYLGHLSYHHGEKTATELNVLDAPIGDTDGDATMHDRQGDETSILGPDAASRSEAEQLIWDEIEQIPQPNRDMVVRWMNGDSYRDMQADFGTTFVTIGNIVRRELDGIKQRLAAKGILNLSDLMPESVAVDGRDGKFVYGCLKEAVTMALLQSSVKR